MKAHAARAVTSQGAPPAAALQGPGPQRRKLAIGPADDAFEREADAVAARITRMSGPPMVQRACAACAKDEDHPPTLRLKAAGAPRADVAVTGLGRGAPLPASERAFFEPRLGRNLGDVRVHAEAKQATSLGARAFALGRDLAFAPGEWRPGTPSGRTLLAHELVHVLQQDRGGTPMLRRQPAPPPVGQKTTCVGDACFEDTPGATWNPAGTVLSEGWVDRREYVKGDQNRVIRNDSVMVSWDPINCSLTVPHVVRFQQPPSGTWGTCQGGANATVPVPNISAARFTKFQADFLRVTNERLNGWYEVQLSGKSCPQMCSGQVIPIQMRVATASQGGISGQAPVSDVTPVNRPGRSYVSGHDIVLCMGGSDLEATIGHEGVHFALAHGDEYKEDDATKVARAPRGQYSPEREIEDNSSMAASNRAHGRFAMLHERHFQFAASFLEGLYPGCKATLVAKPRPIKLSFAPFQFAGGPATVNGLGGGFMSFGLELGVPLDRIRRWQLTVGPRLTMLWGAGDSKRREAVLAGVRMGFAYRSSPGQGGLRLGAFAEGGYGKFSSSDYSGGAYDETTKAPYGEGGVSLGYRFGTGASRFVLGAEAAVGGALGTAVVGPVTPNIARDPGLTHYVRYGITLGFEL